MLIKKKLQRQEEMWISDDPDLVRRCLKEKRPAIGLFSESEKKDWSGVPYLVMDMEELPESYFQKIADRLAGRPVVIAETKRLWIREMALSDLDALFAIYREEGDPIVRSEMAVREHFPAYIRDTYEMYDCGIYGVFLRETGEMIGIAGAEPKEYEGKAELQLGYLICERMRRQGYAMEAVAGICRYLEEEFPDVPLVAEIETKNKASLQLAGKLGIAVRLLES